MYEDLPVQGTQNPCCYRLLVALEDIPRTSRGDEVLGIQNLKGLEGSQKAQVINIKEMAPLVTVVWASDYMYIYVYIYIHIVPPNWVPYGLAVRIQGS